MTEEKFNRKTAIAATLIGTALWLGVGQHPRLPSPPVPPVDMHIADRASNPERTTFSASSIIKAYEKGCLKGAWRMNWPHVSDDEIIKYCEYRSKEYFYEVTH